MSVFDASHAVGLRSHYVMSALVAPSMVERRSGLIVNVSSSGGRDYLFDVAYGCGKACLDRMGAVRRKEKRGENREGEVGSAWYRYSVCSVAVLQCARAISWEMYEVFDYNIVGECVW